MQKYKNIELIDELRGEEFGLALRKSTLLYWLKSADKEGMKEAYDLLTNLKVIERKEKVNCAVKHIVIDYSKVDETFLMFYRKTFWYTFGAFILNSTGTTKTEFLNKMDSEISKRKTKREKTELK